MIYQVVHSQQKEIKIPRKYHFKGEKVETDRSTKSIPLSDSADDLLMS
ncbi:hypothetical protein F7734_05760 [Scytonema sp. UIC 10036]|nr:hypothetical protein [Scytonema sp. UIC 10036]MUG91991.1 hypothetical protein [Scytonema sp. UIC 10036]